MCTVNSVQTRKVLEYPVELAELQTVLGYNPTCHPGSLIEQVVGVYTHIAAAVERTQGITAEADPMVQQTGLLLWADVVTRGGNACRILLFPATVVLMRRKTEEADPEPERIGSWPRTQVSACIDAAAGAVRAATTTTAMKTHSSDDLDLVTLVVPKVGTTKLRFKTQALAELWVRELYRAQVPGLGDGDGWSLFADKPLTLQIIASDAGEAAVMAAVSAAAVPARGVGGGRNASAGSGVPVTSASGSSAGTENVSGANVSSVAGPSPGSGPGAHRLRAYTAPTGATELTPLPSMSPKTSRAKWGFGMRRGTSGDAGNMVATAAIAALAGRAGVVGAGAGAGAGVGSNEGTPTRGALRLQAEFSGKKGEELKIQLPHDAAQVTAFTVISAYGGTSR
jgi:hypothetical protein